MDSEWVFHSRCTRVVDGDTLDVETNLGFQISREERVRLSGVDTAEIYGTEEGSEEHELGEEQKRFVQEWVEEGRRQVGNSEWPFLVRTRKETGKYGRYLATVQRKGDGAYLANDILAEFRG